MENITPEGKKVENEIVPKSPEAPIVENVEVSNEQVLEHAASAERQIDEQAAGVLRDAEKKIESNAKSMGVSPEMLDVVKQEVGVDGYLGEIGVEVFRFADEAKREIGAITEGVWTTHEDGVVRNEKGQRAVSSEDLENPLVREWLMKEALIKAVIQDRRDEGFVENKTEATNEMREFKRMLNEFETTYSLEELYAIVDLTADPDRKHPLRDPAKKALNPINEFRLKYVPQGDNELNVQWKKISNAVGMINKGMVDHNR